MKRFCVILTFILSSALLANAAELSTTSSKDLVALYQQLRAIQGGGQAASAENVVFKRDAATFTFIGGRITFAEPVAGKVLAAHFQGEGKFELEPPSPIDQRQLARFAGSGKLADTFREAIFFFTDDSFEEMNKLMKVRTAPKAADAPFAGKQKQYANDFNDWIDNQRKRNPVIRNMAARMLADLTDKTSKGFFLADFSGSKMGDLIFHISYNRDSLLFPLRSMNDEVFLLHVKPGDYHEWISGFHLLPEYAKSQHPDHRDRHVESPSALIDMQILKDNTIAVKAELDFVVNEGAARVIPFNLGNVLRISSIENSAGKQLAFIQEDKKLDSDPWVILDAPAQAGEKDKIAITYKEDSTYETRIINDRGGSLYSVASRESWYPTFGKSDGRTIYEIRARSPKKLAFVASGSLVKSEKEKDELVTVWKTEGAVGAIGFNYGDFVEATQATPTMKLTAYAGRALPNSLQGVERGSLQGSIMRDNRADAGLMRLDTASMVKNAAATSIGAVTYFEFLFGKLPSKNISVVQQPEAGITRGWPNLVLLPYTSFLDQATLNNLGFMRTAEQRENVRLGSVHELAHQWWDYLVGGKTYHDQWIWDGAADFASSMYLRQFDPGELNNFGDIRRKWLLSKNSSGYRPVDAGPAWLCLQLNDHDQIMNALYVSLYKGGYIYEMLRVLMYDPQTKGNPNGRFIAMMRDFTSTFAGQDVSTEDFRRIVEKHAGRSMEWFFNEWVYGSETPTYDFSYQLSNADGGQTEVAVTLTQSDVSDSFRMQLPLYAVVNGTPQYIGLIGVVGNKPLKTSIKLPFRPDKMVLDPERNILAEIRQ